MTSTERVGFVGLGIMGSRQAANLARAGYELTVYNRTRATADAWVAEHGGTVAPTPAGVGAASDVVITMVVDGDQVRAALLGPDGVADGRRAGRPVRRHVDDRAGADPRDRRGARASAACGCSTRR